MANTTNFGWETPDDTDLVKDGALAMRTLGNAIDTSLVDLKGGTTGQVLSKNTNTDMDFTWVTPNDADAIQNSIVDAKGDLISATADNTPARLASSGVNGQVLTVDTTTSTGLKWAAPAGGGDTFTAGKNKIINGDFRINQRNFTSNTTTGSYNFDRFRQINGGSSGTLTITPQTFTPGTAPVSGYEGVNFVRCVTASGASTNTFAQLQQLIEDVRTFAGRTITVSFWAKAGSGTPNIQIEIEQNFGSGGSASVYTATTKQAITTSWTRYSFTVAVPSVSGKTIGTSSFLATTFWLSAGSDFNTRSDTLGLQNATFDIWGVQAEIGSSATDFQTATGTLAGELAACQRYYYRIERGDAGSSILLTLFGTGTGTTTASIIVPFQQTMRTRPTAIEFSNVRGWDGANVITLTSLTFGDATTTVANVNANASSGFTLHRPTTLMANGTAHIAFSAEL